jgi:hypothetical protein
MGLNLRAEGADLKFRRDGAGRHAQPGKERAGLKAGNASLRTMKSAVTGLNKPLTQNSR